MDARQLVHVAAVVANHSSVLIDSNEPFPEVAVERYWTACRCRQDGWGRALKQFALERQDLQLSIESKSDNWIQPILEEVLSSETLSRIWAAVVELADAKRGTAGASPIAQNILAGHLEARNRVLSLMVYGYGLGVEQAVALNRLRLRNERWTDTLLSFIGPAAARSTWAFQPRVVRRLAESLRQQDMQQGRSFAKSILLSTLAAAYQQVPSEPTPHAELNRRIACSVIACFPPHLFDATGQLISPRQLRLLQVAPDAQGRLSVTEASRRAKSDEDKASDGPFGRFRR